MKCKQFTKKVVLSEDNNLYKSSIKLIENNEKFKVDDILRVTFDFSIGKMIINYITKGDK
ncbi:MAG: hypothetical protein ACRCTZ_15125 [Sarcina sp.]